MEDMKMNKSLNTPKNRVRLVFVGWLRNSAEWLPKLSAVANSVGLDCLHWDYGSAGTMVWFNSHPDTARTDQDIVVKLDFARSANGDFLTAQDLLKQKLITAQNIEVKALHGNPLVLCLSTQEPAFCIFQSLSTASQIFYHQTQDVVFCTDTLRLLAALVKPLALNQDAVPHHLLFRTVPGKMTYFKGISKLPIGQIAQFKNGTLCLRQAERFDDFIPEHQVSRITPELVSGIDHKAEKVIGVYLDDIHRLGAQAAIFLSGGVDSKLMANLMASNLAAGTPLNSFSYAMRIPGFEDEIRYRQHAVDLLQTQHRTIDIYAENYPEILEQAIDLLAQPVDNEQDPCYLLLAQALKNQNFRYFFTGSDLECLFGVYLAKRYRQVELLQNIIGARPALKFGSLLFGGIFPNKAFGMKDTAKKLRDIKKPFSPYHIRNRDSMMTNVDTALALFDSNAIRDVVAYRHETFKVLSNSTNLSEVLHIEDYALNAHDEENALAQFLRAYGLELVDAFNDSDFFRWSYSITPSIRYYAQDRFKWLPKQMLDNRLNTQTTSWPKIGGGFKDQLFDWMKEGVLRDMVDSIERPSYMSTADFETLCHKPDWLTWNLLTLDLFQKRVIKSNPLQKLQI
jgi:asparagine synthetase B (glutamine-hydrolysing)